MIAHCLTILFHLFYGRAVTTRPEQLFDWNQPFRGGILPWYTPIHCQARGSFFFIIYVLGILSFLIYSRS